MDLLSIYIYLIIVWEFCFSKVAHVDQCAVQIENSDCECFDLPDHAVQRILAFEMRHC